MTGKQVDANGDGAPDIIETYTLDEQGNRIGTAFADADGNVYAKEEYVLNNKGQVVEKRINTDGKDDTGNADGFDRIEKYTLNAKGEVIATAKDNNADGKTDRQEYYVLNPNGKWLAKYIDFDASTETGVTSLVNGQPTKGIERIETYTLNDKGEIIITAFNNDAKGAPEKIEYLVRDANGHYLARYSNTDGTTTTGREVEINGELVKGINSSTKYMNNAKGYGHVILYDRNADGITDGIDYIELDVNGEWLTKYADEVVNVGNDIQITGPLADYLGTNQLAGIDEIVYYTRDSLGRMISNAEDHKADGDINYIRYIDIHPTGNWAGTYTNADGDDNTGVTYNGAKGIDRREKVYANNQGHTTGRHWDDNMDGIFDRYQKVVTDINGVWREMHSDSNNDGKFESSEFYTVNEYGHRTGTTYVVYKAPVETLKALSEITSDDGRSSTNSYIRDANTNILITANDSNFKDGLIDTLAFSAINHTMHISELLGEDKFALGQIKKSLTRITLSNDTSETNITLDASTLAQISKNPTLDIRGDATDTVNLSGDFTKVEGKTKQVTNTNDVLQAYSTQVDGKAYTVYIDTDVNTIIG